MIKNNKSICARGVVFGVFDGLHAGHQFFLREAAKRCDQLVVVVALTEIVELLKKHPPQYSLDERVLKIKEFNSEFLVLPSDLVLGRWSVFDKYYPEIVFLGYDQKEIAKELEKIKMPYVFLVSHHPAKYKSSIL